MSGLHTSCAPVHEPLQKPPHPFGAPHTASAAQCVMHSQWLSMQRWGGTQAGVHPQVSTHVPLLQTWPGLQCTLKHGFTMHAPARQNCPSGHVTPSHTECGVQVRSQANPVPHAASHGVMGVHDPFCGLQYWPVGHETPSHATGKQPGKHVPLTHVSFAAQAMPAHGSVSATQIARQRSVAMHGLAVAQGSAWQRLPKQSCPAGQSRSVVQRAAPPS